MGQVREVQPVKILAGLLSRDVSLFETVKFELEREWGPVDQQSELVEFNFTRYYEQELGSDLKRLFISFAGLADPGRLPEMKLLANHIEDKLAVDGRRRVNIDPGYITPARLILATTKDHAHRVYLGRGIYGDLTLIYSHSQGSFKPLPWTYPDYCSEEYAAYFKRVRELCREQLRISASIIFKR
ncbi:MAG TPA: DUF4416 domain-containing protein [Desulfotomaculum sp.]|nr:MAG: GTP-binding protein [Desulfotomaculum sp. 46_80]HAG10358.1 DUF4416 domain-containing protein [Desulfotomaculum sp.]HBY04147.1 DUF4416 domain-containing protein [Desulfotomaculum sp.]